MYVHSKRQLPMLVQIHARDFALSEALDNYTDSKIRVALGLFREKIRRVDVFLTDVNGPKGGEDKNCKIIVKLDRHNADIVAHETAPDMYDAINTCSHRVKRTVARQCERDREIRRPRYNVG